MIRIEYKWIFTRRGTTQFLIGFLTTFPILDINNQIIHDSRLAAKQKVQSIALYYKNTIKSHLMILIKGNSISRNHV
jgi:hypothetical protein